MEKTSLSNSLSIPKRNEIDLDSVKKGVEKLSSNKNGEPGEQKFQVFLDKDDHKQIRIFCLENNIKMKDFAKDAILEKAKDLKII